MQRRGKMRSEMVVPIYHGSVDTGADNRSNLLSLLLWLLRFISLLQITWVLKKVLSYFKIMFLEYFDNTIL